MATKNTDVDTALNSFANAPVVPADYYLRTFTDTFMVVGNGTDMKSFLPEPPVKSFLFLEHPEIHIACFFFSGKTQYLHTRVREFSRCGKCLKSYFFPTFA